MTVRKNGDVVAVCQTGVDMVPVPPASVWSKLNAAMTDEERQLFNEWRREIWVTVDKLRDESRRSTASIQSSDAAKRHMQLVSAIPFMEGR